jgi:hypothetical protein
MHHAEAAGRSLISKPREAAMLNFEDFTVLPRGFDVPLEGRVESCPACGRNGIEARPECEDPYFLHRQSSELLGDGMRTDPFDRCPLVAN